MPEPGLGNSSPGTTPSTPAPPPGAGRHSGIGYFTPAAVHFGTAQRIFTDRQRTLQLAYASHPERFVKGRPVPPALPTAVWINPPKAGLENPIVVVEAGDPVDATTLRPQGPQPLKGAQPARLDNPVRH